MEKAAIGKVISPRRSPLLRWVEEESGQRVRRCYQCGKCSAGCPLSYAMDWSPRQVIRALQLGLDEEALSSSAIWLCANCFTCTIRCPLEIDVAKVMEALRHKALAEGKPLGEKQIPLFYRIFNAEVKRWARTYELGLGFFHTLASRRFLANARHLPGLLARGRLSFLPPLTKGRRKVGAIFEKATAQSKEK